MMAGDLTAVRLLESCLERIHAGDAIVRPWTVSGFPAVSLPTGLDQNGLPWAMQIAAQPYAEERLLAVAAWCERVLAFAARPPKGG